MLARDSNTATNLNTAFQALYGAREFGPTHPHTGPDEIWVFTHGGSSEVGQFAIQLVIQLTKLSGYKVVGVASPRNHELLRTLGADALFDVRILHFTAVSALGV